MRRVRVLHSHESDVEDEGEVSDLLSVEIDGNTLNEVTIRQVGYIEKMMNQYIYRLASPPQRTMRWRPLSPGSAS